ncbi:5'-methylthioadenosine/adenosylhomocysteine nucleosidase [Salinispira pacifica]
MIALLGAFDEEITALVQSLEGAEKREWNQFLFHEGTLEGRRVVVAKSGVGKSLAAMLTQKIIDHYAPESIIFTGLAGAINPDLDIGDTVVGRDCLQHDMDATALGFKRGEIPYSNFRVFRCDEELARIALECEPAPVSVETGNSDRKPRVAPGRILTGDTFLAQSMMKGRGYLREELAGDAVEMEGASVGLVASVNGVPFLIIRTISDRADGNARVDFNRFVPWASKNSLRFVLHILRRLGSDA